MSTQVKGALDYLHEIKYASPLSSKAYARHTAHNVFNKQVANDYNQQLSNVIAHFTGLEHTR